jgi:hypothetical protein
MEERMMSKVYLSEQHIPELQGVVRGAATIVLTEPDEVEGLQSLCLLAGRPLTDPAVGIWEALARPAVNLTDWKLQREHLGIQLKHWQEWRLSRDQPDDVQEIIVALGLAHAIWKNQDEDIPNLSLMLSVAHPDGGAERVIELQGENPGWVLHKGSLRSSLFLGALRAGSFVVGLLSKGGIGVERRADDIVEGLRSKQLEKIPRVANLQRLDQLQPGALKDNCGVIIFLHGLLSTDLGTFDVLIDYLRDQGLQEPDFAFVGWPHDTLTRIEFNATELANDIEHVLGKKATELPKLAFACHSRGGLLARYASAILYEGDINRWQRQIGGCVTFGTPHEGSGLADAPDQLIACFIAAGAWRESGRMAGLSDVLWVSKNNKVLEGVEDLRTLRGKLPERNRDPFQKTLTEKERAASPSTARILDIMTIGGRVQIGTKWYYDLAGRALAGVEHDVAVPLTSSRPKMFQRNEPPIECDHFSYFSMGETQKPHYFNVAQYLKQVLDWSNCEARRMQRALNKQGGMREDEGAIYPNEVRVEKKDPGRFKLKLKPNPDTK